MEIKKLREDKFEVILHIDDLEKFNINISQFMSRKLETLEIFPLILKYIDKLSCFSLETKKIIFETFFINDSYFLIKFYIIGILSPEGNFVSKVCGYLSISDNSPMIFRFSSFDTLCDFFRYLNNMNNDKLFVFLDFISFFYYKNEYYLILKNSIFSTDLFDFTCLQISEFAKFVSCSDIFARKIEEFGLRS